MLGFFGKHTHIRKSLTVHPHLSHSLTSSPRPIKIAHYWTEALFEHEGEDWRVKWTSPRNQQVRVLNRHKSPVVHQCFISRCMCTLIIDFRNETHDRQFSHFELGTEMLLKSVAKHLATLVSIVHAWYCISKVLASLRNHPFDSLFRVVAQAIFDPKWGLRPSIICKLSPFFPWHQVVGESAAFVTTRAPFLYLMALIAMPGKTHVFAYCEQRIGLESGAVLGELTL